MNKEVSFPIAKLLKEKGFDLPTKKYYEYALKSRKNKEDGYSGPFGWKKGELNLQSDYFQNNSKSDFTSEMWYMCSAPTIAEVVMWLYEKHGIWIELTMGKDHTGVWFNWDIFSTITPRKDDVLGEEGVEYEDDPNEKWLNYDTTYSSMIDERFATMDKESCSSIAQAYEAGINYTLTKLI